MMTRHIRSLCLLVAGMCAFAFSQSAFTVDSGTILVKKAIDSKWTVLDETKTVETSDLLMVADNGEARCLVANGVTVRMKDSCLVVYKDDETAVTLTLIKGQIFFDRTTEAESGLFIIESRNCTIIPVGTAAAVKPVKQADVSVAVLRGTVRMTDPQGTTVDVGEGMYCSYSDESKGFTPVKALSEKAMASLKSWSGVSGSAAEQELAGGEKSEVAQPVTEPAVTSPPTIEPVNQPPTQVEPATQPQEAEKMEPQKPEKTAAQKQEAKNEKKGPAKPAWEVSAGMVTVGDEQWTRIGLAVDVPIWRFGVCFDLELFMDAQGDFSNKAWNFDSPRDVGQTLLRKIRYIRFNQPGDPLFIKVGGLDNVTFGYGFVVDRFTNMLRYPDEKLFGLQFDLNDVSPIGITLQTLIPDFQDFGNDGGILAARLAVKPLKMTELPLLGGISIGATVAADLNQYAPARQWDFSLNGKAYDRDEDDIIDGNWLDDWYVEVTGDSMSNTEKYTAIAKGLYDTIIEHKDQWTQDTTDPATVLGGDVIIPIISSKVVSLDLYAQAGVMVDDESDDSFYKGWGIGAPGVGLKVGPMFGQVEFRHVEDYFSPGYFGTYYLEERLRRTPEISVKEQTLTGIDLNGVFGVLGVNIANILLVEGRYQMMVGDKDTSGDKARDQRFEASAGLGSMLLDRIPKINKVELFYSQTEIDGNAFYQSPTTFWGYRLGSEIMAGASIIWETRYGWVWNDDKTKLIDNKTMTIKAAITF